MSDESITYCGAWSENGPTRRYDCKHISQNELDHLSERARTNALASGIKPDTPELDAFIADQLFATLPAIDAYREAEAAVQAKRSHLRVVTSEEQD